MRLNTQNRRSSLPESRTRDTILSQLAGFVPDSRVRSNLLT